MPLKQASKTIAGHDYATTAFGGVTGIKLKARLARVIAPTFGPMASAMLLAEPGKDNELEGLQSGNVFAGFAALEPEEFAKLAVDLLAMTTMDGMPVGGDGPGLAKFNEHYAANYGELYKALGWVADFNFGSVFGEGGISGLIAKTKALAAKKLSKKTSESSTQT